MAHAVTMRATSMLASATILGALLIAALTMSVTLLPQVIEPEAPPILIQAPAPPPPAPPVIRSTPTPPQDAVIQTPFEFAEPVEPTEVATSGEVVATALPQTITRPHWLRRPANLQAYYPRRALQSEIEGDVVLNCLVTRLGALQCVVISETPEQWGFAAAALRIAGDHQMAPALREGVPVEGRYRMRVPFRVE